MRFEVARSWLRWSDVDQSLSCPIQRFLKLSLVAGKFHDLAQDCSVLNLGEAFTGAISKHRLGSYVMNGDLPTLDQLAQEKEA